MCWFSASKNFWVNQSASFAWCKKNIGFYCEGKVAPDVESDNRCKEGRKGPGPATQSRTCGKASGSGLLADSALQWRRMRKKLKYPKSA